MNRILKLYTMIDNFMKIYKMIDKKQVSFCNSKHFSIVIIYNFLIVDYFLTKYIII